MDNDLILSILQEIKEVQKEIAGELNDLKTMQTEIRTELAILRNGYTPHEIVELLHWVEREKLKSEQQSASIRSAIIGWIVPIVCSAAVAGLIMYFK